MKTPEITPQKSTKKRRFVSIYSLDMIVYPNSKINLGLNILYKRPDGFHELQTLFYPLGLCDALEVIVAADGIPLFSSSGIAIPDNGAPNLCQKAWSLLAADFALAPVAIHLHKKVPIGAGLGGGSADAAFTLKVLNELFDLGLEMEQLKTYAARLGSDCAFFIENQPALASGRGEVLTPYALDLKGFHLVLITPPIHVSTPQAYAGIQPAIPAKDLSWVLQQGIGAWKDLLINDFEKTVFAQFPRIAQIKKHLYETGAVYAAMSGSGAAVFGLFKQPVAFDQEQEFSDCFIWQEHI